jgi:hypothetical protein
VSSESHNRRCAAGARPQLTDDQQRRVGQAQELAEATAASLSAGYGHIDPEDQAQVYGYAFGAAQYTVRTLLMVIAELAGGAR